MELKSESDTDTDSNTDNEEYIYKNVNQIVMIINKV